MRSRYYLNFSVGILMLCAIIALLMLAFKVSGLTRLTSHKGYIVEADFTNIGDLKVRAPVTIAGVRVGEVDRIELQPQSFDAKVSLKIDANQNKIPATDAEARILTQGLLGSNYISITPGFEASEPGEKTRYLHNGDKIEKTQQAVILENLIGQLLFNINK